VLLIGGGEVAARKARLLLAAGARLRVVALTPCPEISSLAATGEVDLVIRPYQPGDLAAPVPRLVVAATDDQAVNRAVALDAGERGVLVNVVDDPANSTGIVPAIIDRDPVLVACSTGGSAPVLATELRARIETLLPPRLGSLAAFCRRHRAAVQARYPEGSARRQFWLSVMRGEIAESVLAGDEGLAEQQLLAALGGPLGTVVPRCTVIQLASDDPDLLQLRVLRRLFATDVIVHEAALSPAILTLARRDAFRVPVVVSEDPTRDWLFAIDALGSGPGEITCLTHLSAPLLTSLEGALRARGFLTTLWLAP
jgi:uroporphyrin-III C-methyltransferase/precorrin-2 dehydrogenase/sirohydrochlorin ferrochelatase